MTSLRSMPDIGTGRGRHSNLLSNGSIGFRRAISCSASPDCSKRCSFPRLYNARRFAFDLDSMPRLRRIEAACLVHPAFVKPPSDNQPDSPEYG